LRETLLVGRVARSTKEALATVVSDLNQCPWCVESHSISLYALGEAQTVTAITQHKGFRTFPDALSDLFRWAYASLTPGAGRSGNFPFSAEDAPEVMGTVVNFHYLNRMVTALLAPSPLPDQVWLRKPFQRVMGLLVARSGTQAMYPGESLAFLPNAILPEDMAWAAGSPSISAAFAGFAAVLEDVGKRALPDRVRALICDHASRWNGEKPPLSRNWVEDTLYTLPDSDKAVARLALLALRAPYQIDNKVIEAFRGEHHGDDLLIEVLAWSAFVAARRIGNWLWAPTSVFNSAN
jgi:AhpD family alkylhydroperoxidase